MWNINKYFCLPFDIQTVFTGRGAWKIKKNLFGELDE